MGEDSENGSSERVLSDSSHESVLERGAGTVRSQQRMFRRPTMEGSVASGATFRQQTNLADFLQEALDVDELVVDDDDDDDLAEDYSESVHDLYLAAFQKLAVDEAAFRRHEGEEGVNATNMPLDMSKTEESTANPSDAAGQKPRSMTKPTMFRAMGPSQRKMNDPSTTIDNSMDCSSSIESEASGMEKGQIGKDIHHSQTGIMTRKNRVLFYLCMVLVGVSLGVITFFVLAYLEPSAFNTLSSKIKGP